MQFPPLSTRDRQSALQKMVEIRSAEEHIQELFLANLVRGTTHLAIGQEACAVGVIHALRPGDSVTCTYRGHHHALAMGMSLRALMAEMMGKASGACKGKGGSMHMTDATLGLFRRKRHRRRTTADRIGRGADCPGEEHGAVSVTFFGEGAANIGVFHETLNMASIWKLPVVFVCENNLYGEYSVWHKTTPIQDIAQRAASYAMPGAIVDGQDVEGVAAAAAAAVAHARAGDGPTLLELKTYRYRGHSRTDTGPYRPAGELEQWQQRDPLSILKERMIADGQLDEPEYAEMLQAVEQNVVTAIEWAKAEPFPPLDSLYQDVFYEG